MFYGHNGIKCKWYFVSGGEWWREGAWENFCIWQTYSLSWLGWWFHWCTHVQNMPNYKFSIFTVYYTSCIRAPQVAHLVKKSTCNTEDAGSISGLGRSTGKGTGYPLQYSWASLVAQLEKNPPKIRRSEFDPWVGKIPWRREWLPIPLFCPG